jgi:PAS domain S-box-containing protein
MAGHGQAEELHRKLSLAVEASPVTVVITDVKGDIEYVNPMFTRLTGYTFNEAKGKNPRILKTGETSPEEYKRLWDTITTGGEWRGEFHNKKKNGDLYWEFAVIAPIRDPQGHITNFMAIKEDITERKKVEDALKLTSFSLDHARDIIFWFYPDGRFYYVNDAACQQFGCTREELMAMTIFDINPEYTKESWEERWQKLRKEGSHSYVTVNRARDGSLFPVEVTSSYIKYRDLELICGYARDITARRQAEEAIRQAKEQAELYLDLMGHDINNMHQIALGYLEMARDSGLPDGQKELLDKPIEVLQRSARLIQNVRKLQKLKDGLFRTEAMDVKRLLASLPGESGAMPGKSILLDIDGHGQCLVMANELLHDVFANLVGNAVKHTGDRAEIRITMELISENGKPFCRVCVEDNGPGIPDNFKGKIFDRLLKGTDKAKGMGLGLYLVKSLVTSYHGQVWVEDRVPGDYTQGAKFVVMLPAIEK